MDASLSPSASPPSRHQYDCPRSPLSALSSLASDYHTDSDSTTDDEDDDEGVFIGPHDPQEARLIARLSATSLASPTSSISKRPRPSIRKRDSTEILRRRSVLHTVVANGACTPRLGTPPSKVYPGGFYEKGTRVLREEANDSSDEDSSTPRRLHFATGDLSPTHANTPGCSHSDLTFDFSNFRLTGFSPSLKQSPRLRTAADEPLDEVSEDEGYPDSDKENVVESSFHTNHDDPLVGFEDGEFASATDPFQDTDHEEVSDGMSSPITLDMGGLRLSDFSDPGSPTPALIERATSRLDAFVSEEAEHDLLAEPIVGADSTPGSEDETDHDELSQSPPPTRSEVPERDDRRDSISTVLNVGTNGEDVLTIDADTRLFEPYSAASDLGTFDISVEPVGENARQTEGDFCIAHLADSLSLHSDGSPETIDRALQTTEKHEALYSTEVDTEEETVQSLHNEEITTHSIHADGDSGRTVDSNPIASDLSAQNDLANGSTAKGPPSGAETEIDLDADIVSADHIIIASTNTTVSAEPVDEVGQPAEVNKQHPVEMAEQAIADAPSAVPAAIGGISGDIPDESDAGSASGDDMDMVIVASAEAPGPGTPNAKEVNGDVPPSTSPAPPESAISASPEPSASSESPGPSGSDIDSPLPQARGGFVVIPTLPSHLAFSMRAENGSPCRSLPTIPAPQIEVKAVSEPAVMLSAILSSPASKDACEIPREVEPSPSSAICRPRKVDQSSTTPPERVPANKDDPFKCSTSSHPTSTADRPRPTMQALREEKQAAARAVTIRNQLDTVFVSRLGPPQRMLLRSSSSTSKAVRKPVSRTMPSTQPKDVEAPRSRLMMSSSSNGSAASGSSSASSRGVKDPLPPTATTASKLPTAMKASRAPLVPRNPTLPSAGLRMPLALGRPSNTRPAGTIPRPVASAAMAKIPSTTSHQTNPLKRSLSTAPAHNAARSTVSVGYGAPVARPTLGLPSRTGRPVELPVITTSGLTTGTCGAVTCIEPRSPMRTAPKKLLGTPSAPRILGTPLRLGTPSRNGRLVSLGTPSRNPNGTPSRPRAALKAQTSSATTNTADAPVIEATPATPPSCPDSAAVKERGSSEDHDAVSLQLQRDSSQQSSSPINPGRSLRTRTTPSASPSPVKPNSDQPVIRPRRSIKPPEKIVNPPPKVSKTAAPSSVPGMSEKELKAITQLHTSRNEVYHCAIDRQIVRKSGPRPPSPTSKIRTTADRAEAEKKAGRSDRAKRRSKGSDTETTDLPPVIERVTYTKGPGDDEDWKTPSRPSKKAKTKHDKTVNWDKELLVIRDDGRAGTESVPNQRDQVLKSALRRDGQAKLDANGNLIEGPRPKESLKRQKIVVTAIFYDGEEPVPPPPTASTGNGTTGTKGKKR